MSLRTTITDLERQRADRVQEFLGTYPDMNTELVYTRFLIGLADTEKSIHRVVMAARSVEGKAKFSPHVCDKFPTQIGRHELSPENARWMLRNTPILPLTDLDVIELKAAARGDST